MCVSPISCYQYNAASMITNILLESGTNLAYSYDELDRVVSETSVSSVTSVVAYSYDEVGNRLTKTKDDGTTVSYQYANGCNRLTGWTAASTNDFATCLASEISGSVSEIIGTNSGLGQCYVSNSLTGVSAIPSISGTNFSLAASLLPLAAGYNQIVAAIGDAAGNAGYATNTVLIQVITNASYGFSAAGCITNITYSGPGVSETLGLTWNSQYQLAEMTTNGVSAERYGFDPFGRRVWTAQGTTTNFHVYDGVHCIADLNATGGLIRTYTFGPGVDNLLALTVHTGTAAKTYFALSDHLGSVHAMVDESGTIVESYRFDAWGRVLGVYNGSGNTLTESAIGNRILWQGREYSWKTGLYYFRARWYDPITGRWMSNDPIGISGGLNQYCFCGNNPVNFTDPMGLQDLGSLPAAFGITGDPSAWALQVWAETQNDVRTPNDLWRKSEGIGRDETLYDASIRLETQYMGGHGPYGGGYAHSVFFGLLRREYGRIPAWWCVAGYNTIFERNWYLWNYSDPTSPGDREADWVGFALANRYSDLPMYEAALLVYPQPVNRPTKRCQ